MAYVVREKIKGELREGIAGGIGMLSWTWRALMKPIRGCSLVWYNYTIRACWNGLLHKLMPLSRTI